MKQVVTRKEAIPMLKDPVSNNIHIKTRAPATALSQRMNHEFKASTNELETVG